MVAFSVGSAEPSQNEVVGNAEHLPLKARQFAAFMVGEVLGHGPQRADNVVLQLELSTVGRPSVCVRAAP